MQQANIVSCPQAITEIFVVKFKNNLELQEWSIQNMEMKKKQKRKYLEMKEQFKCLLESGAI